MTADELKVIEERCNVATPGEWYWRPGDPTDIKLLAEIRRLQVEVAALRAELKRLNEKYTKSLPDIDGMRC